MRQISTGYLFWQLCHMLEAVKLHLGCSVLTRLASLAHNGAVIMPLLVSLLAMCYVLVLDMGYSTALPSHRHGNQLIFSAMMRKQEARHWPTSPSF